MCAPSDQNRKRTQHSKMVVAFV